MNTRQKSQECYSVRGAAEFLGVSEKTVRRLIERGDLPASKPVRRVIIQRHHLDELLSRHLVGVEGAADDRP